MYRACMPCFDDYWSANNNAHRLLAPGPTGMRMDRSAAPPVPTAKPAKAPATATVPTAKPAKAPPAAGKSAAAPPKKRALLVGINYFGTEAELNGCINDVRTMRAFLQQQGFEADAMRCLTDDAYQPQLQPTRLNILQGLKWLVHGAAAGDVFFFHFSGHGGQQVDVHGDEEDGMDETICPVDFVREGQISDDELFALLAAPLPSGCRLTALLDCCHSGHGMDFPFTRTGAARGCPRHPCRATRSLRRRRRASGGAWERRHRRRFARVPCGGRAVRRVRSSCPTACGAARQDNFGRSSSSVQSTYSLFRKREPNRDLI